MKLDIEAELKRINQDPDRCYADETAGYREALTRLMLLRDCHKLLAGYVGATYRPKKLAEWEKKLVELMERIESAVKP